jgi:hypothetical protein
MAQDVNCKVEVNAERVGSSVDPKVFIALKRNAQEFINNRKWTTDNYKATERIECSFILTITERLGNEPIYKANLNIVSYRPVFSSGYNTTLFSQIDRDVTFRFEESQVFQFDDNRVTSGDALASNLTAILAYYTYMIVGYDYDSFSPNGGTEYFKKALNIVNNAPEEGKNIRGWKSSEGNRNRYWIVDQILNPRFETFRPAFYQYHREGLDLMYKEPEKARQNVMLQMSILNTISTNNPSSFLIQLFFNAKSLEIMNMLGQMPNDDFRKNTIEQLCKMDVSNNSKYRSIK